MLLVWPKTGRSNLEQNPGLETWRTWILLPGCRDMSLCVPEEWSDLFLVVYVNDLLLAAST